MQNIRGTNLSVQQNSRCLCYQTRLHGCTPHRDRTITSDNYLLSNSPCPGNSSGRFPMALFHWAIAMSHNSHQDNSKPWQYDSRPLRQVPNQKLFIFQDGNCLEEIFCLRFARLKLFRALFVEIFPVGTGRCDGGGGVGNSYSYLQNINIPTTNTA